MANTGYISKLKLAPSGTDDHLEDNVDSVHTGIIKALNIADAGSYIAHGMDVTSVSDGTFDITAGGFFRRGEYVSFDAVVDQSDLTNWVGDPNYDFYGLLVVAANNSIGFRYPAGTLSSVKVANPVDGDIPICVVQILKSSAAASARKFQYLGIKKTSAALTAGVEDSGTFDEKLKIGTDGKVYKNGSAHAISFPTVSGAKTLAVTTDIPSGNTIIDWTASGAGTIHATNYTDTNTWRGITAGGNTLASNETLAFTAGSNVTVTESAGAVTIASADTQLTDEQVQDIVGDMVDDTETFISVTYDDTNGNLEFVVPVKDEDDMTSNSATHLATQQSIKAYVDTEVSDLIDSSPSALNTLNELAAALGDDANFATTTSTALGNRLRIDTDSQSLTSTQLTNVKTNLSLAKADVGLGDVSNITTAAMRAGVTHSDVGTTATNVGLGNVTNESKATMFTSPTFTGTVAIPNVTNLETAVVANTAKTGITTSQANAITANTAKVTYPSADSTKVGYLTVTGATDLDDIKTKVNFSSATDLGTAGDIANDVISIYDDGASAYKKVKMKDFLTKITSTQLVSGGGGTGSIWATLPASGATVGADWASNVSNISVTNAQLAGSIANDKLAGSIALSKLANISTGRFLGRTDSGTGAIEQLDASAVKTGLSLVKGDVGLGNVNNTTDAGKPVSTATQTILDLKATIASPTFTGTIAIPNVANLETAVTANTAKVSYTDASAVSANTAKVTFPGFGTSNSTALVGDTTIDDVSVANITARLPEITSSVTIGDADDVDITILGDLIPATIKGVTVPATPAFTDTVYSHPTSAGNKHIPADGASGNFLKYDSSGTAVWATPSYTTALAWGDITGKPSTFAPIIGSGATDAMAGNTALLALGTSGTTALAGNTTVTNWSGGSSGLTASTGRTSLGATTFGAEVFTLADTDEIRFLRMDADNGVSALSASDFRSAIGAGSSTDLNDYVDSASFSSGTITLGRTGSLSDLTVDISAVDTNTTYSNFTDSAAGLVPTPGEDAAVKFLRQDQTWVVPTDTNDDVSVANLKARLDDGFGGDAVQIGDANDSVTIPKLLATTLNGATVPSSGAVFTDTNTHRAISSSPTDGASTTSISSDWAFDNVKTAVPTGAIFADFVPAPNNSTNGTRGLVPAPPANTYGTLKFLQQDGTWTVPADTLPNATNVATALGNVGDVTLTLGDGDTAVSIPGDLTVTGTTTTNHVETISTSNGVIFEGSTADAYETNLMGGNPPSSPGDITITLPTTAGTLEYAAIYDNAGTPTLKSGITQAEMQTAIGGVYTDTVYTHPTHDGDDISIDTSGANIIDTLTITTNTLGHVTDASATTRALTLANLGYTGEADATADQTAAEIASLFSWSSNPESGADVTDKTNVKAALALLDSTDTTYIGDGDSDTQLTVRGNLSILGSASNVIMDDPMLVLNYGDKDVNILSADLEDYVGIEVEMGKTGSNHNAHRFLRYNTSTSRWEFTNDGTNYFNLPLSTEYGTGLSGSVDVVGSGNVPVATDFARFTDADTLEGLTVAQMQSALNVADGATANTGTVTELTVGVGLDVANGTSTPDITLDLKEIGSAAFTVADSLVGFVTGGGSGTQSKASDTIGDILSLIEIVDDTSPQLGGNLDTNSHNILIDDAHGILDEDSNELITFSSPDNSPVNYINIANKATGNAPILSAGGDDAAVSLNIRPKGTGYVNFAEGDIQIGSTVLSATGAELNILNNVTAARFIGRNSGSGAGSAEELTVAQALTLLGVEGGAEVNVQPDWTQSTSSHDGFIQNKPTLVTVGSGSSNAMAGNTEVDNVDVAKLKTALANGFSSDTLQIGDGDTTTTFPGDLIVTGTTTTSHVNTVSTSNGVIFEGTVSDGNDLTLKAGTVNSNFNVWLPSAAGTLALTSDNITGTAAGLSATLAIASGGTGATTAANARTGLGLGTGAVLDTAAIADGGTGLATADQIHTFVTGFGYTTNTGTTTASNSQTFTNKGGNISQWTNNSGYTTNAGTVTSVGTNTGLSGTVTGSGNLSLDLDSLADMTQSWDNAADEFIVLDDGTQKKKLSSEIFGSNAFNSTTIPSGNAIIDWTGSNAGTIHSTNYTSGATTFKMHDGDGTEVTLANAREMKFVEGNGIDINWTDTDGGTNEDPFDLTFKIADGGVDSDQLATGGVDLGHLSATGTASSSTYLRGDNTWATVSSGGLSNIVEDTTPQLGGNLDTQGHAIQSSGSKTIISPGSGGGNEVVSIGDDSNNPGTLRVGSDGNNNQLPLAVSVKNSSNTNQQVAAYFLAGNHHASDIGTGFGPIIELRTSTGTAYSGVVSGKISTKQIGSGNSVANHDLHLDAGGTGQVVINDDFKMSSDTLTGPTTWSIDTSSSGGSIRMKNGATEVGRFMSLGFQAIDGTASNPSIAFLNSYQTGLYRPAANQIGLTINGTAQMLLKDGVLEPVTDNDVDIGSSSLEFKDGYFDGTLHCDVLDLAGTEYTSIGGASALDELSDTKNGGTNFTSSLIMGNAVGSVSHGTLNGVNNATGVGHGSLASITEADDVTCLGRNAGGALTTGSNNVLIGSNAGSNWDNSSGITTASHNYIIGTAGSGPMTGGKNVIMGSSAGYAVTSGQGNLLMGYRAGASQTTGQKIVALGHDALYSGTGSNYQVAIGDSAGYSHTGTEGVLIGSDAGKQGGASHGAVHIGRQAGYRATGSDNISIGRAAMFSASSSNTGISNVAIGRNSLYNLTVGGGNISIGENTLNAVSNADYNVAIGYYAGQDVTSGGYGTFVGFKAGYFSTSAYQNVAIGGNALYGVSGTTTGGYNTAVGYNSQKLIQTGAYNNSLGNNSLLNISTGTKNIAIGYQSGDNITSGSNNVVIGGADVTATSDDQLKISSGDGSPVWIEGSSAGVVNIPGSLTVAGSALGNSYIDGMNPPSSSGFFANSTPGWGNNQWGTATWSDTGSLYFPFIAQATGDVQSTGIRTTSAASLTMAQIGFYSDNNGAPNTLIGTAGQIDIANSGTHTVNVSGNNIELVRGTQYWVGIVRIGSATPTTYMQNTQGNSDGHASPSLGGESAPSQSPRTAYRNSSATLELPSSAGGSLYWPSYLPRVWVKVG